ncbi:MAG: metallophosphoesterase [Lachnospiraceae bacterium]|jgi:predicted MPP superfamily phosphohydrolase|nr:metallophosphoesterase [Lachnospiraceae bacterium]
MVAVYMSPGYLILCFYVLWRTLVWLEKCCPYLGKKRVRVPFILIYIAVVFCILIAFLLGHSDARRLLKQFSNVWLGVLLYSLLVIILVDLLRLILKRLPFLGKEKLFSVKAHRIIGGVCALCICVLSVAGIQNADNIQVTEYELYVDKEAGDLDSLNIILVADLHMGYSIGVRQIEQMVEKINEEDPDLVVIAGDIFDNEYEALEDPEALIDILKGIRSKYGVYACYGNHDIQEKILAGFTFSSKKEKASDPRMDAFLEQAGIRLLRDEGVLIGDAFYLYGRPDYNRPGRGIVIRKTPAQITEGMDLRKPVIVLDHEPKELQELADAGVDVDLCGHTHDGQMFPGNLVVRFFWENSYGYLQKDRMHNIVTSGVGVFGPDMRVGTKCEICRITVRFR